jgi:serine/threonine-protein kinase
MEATELGQYRLLQRLGAGGMGEVFLAKLEREEGFSKLLVVKRILPGLSDSSRFREMFATEARIAAALNHPHIIQVTDYGRIARNCFLAMEYIQGTDLAALLDLAQQQRRPVPMDFSVGVGLACLRALGYAHTRQKPVIHGDTSPQNVLVGREGEVKIIDFGLARLSGPPSLEQHREIRGKLSYLPPEVAFGQRPTERSDIFGVGAILYEMAAGVPPLPPVSDFDQALQQARRCMIPKATEVNPDMHPALAHIIDRALAAPSEDRFDDDEMEEALRRVSATLGLDPSPRVLGTFVTAVLGTGGSAAAAEVPRTLVAVPQTPRRRFGLIWMLSILLATAVAAGAWILLQNGPPADSPRPPANLNLAPVIPVAEEPRPEDAGVTDTTDTDPVNPDKPRKKPHKKKRRVVKAAPIQPDAGIQKPDEDPRVEPPPVEKEPGFRLRTNREAFYSIDGEPERPTPVVLKEGLRGVHLLKIRDRNGLSATVRIEVKGDRGNIQLAFRSNPYAILRIDGRPKGLTPIAEISVGRGAHVMTLAVPKSKHVLVLMMEIR